MCLIVDANSAERLLVKERAVIDWLLGPVGEPRLVAAGKLRSELAILNDVRRVLVQLERAGRLRVVDEAQLRKCEKDLADRKVCRSNDGHVIALAIVSGARTLATLDETLAKDFRDASLINKPRGSIFKTSEAHSHLLRHTPSCGVKITPQRTKRK